MFDSDFWFAEDEIHAHHDGLTYVLVLIGDRWACCSCFKPIF